MINTYDLLMVPTDRVDDIIPYDNQIVMKIEFPKVKTSAGIVLTTETGVQREIAQRIIGKVIKIGPNVEFCQVGDEVIFAKYAGVVVSRKAEATEGMGDGWEIRIIDEKNLVARLKRTEEKGA